MKRYDHRHDYLTCKHANTILSGQLDLLINGWNLMLMRRFAQPFLVVLACLGLLAGCGGIGFAYEKRLSGKYGLVAADVLEQRSEERRVGKECRSRWPPYN